MFFVEGAVGGRTAGSLLETLYRSHSEPMQKLVLHPIPAIISELVSEFGASCQGNLPEVGIFSESSPADDDDLVERAGVAPPIYRPDWPRLTFRGLEPQKDHMRLLRLSLTNFRNYASLTWRPQARVTVLVGPNGSGKTNILEALSLLVPGRGLRNARNADLSRRGGPGGWAIAGRFVTNQVQTDIGTGTLPEGTADRRTFRIDGAVPRSQLELAAHVAVVWLTPQMDRLFLEPLSGRRRFLDRLVWTLEPGHAREIAAHDAAMGSRNRLLAERREDASWLAALEYAMARHAVAATAARMALVNRLNAALAGGITRGFPRVRIGLACPIAERLMAEPALSVEDWLRAGLAAGRGRDAAAGGAALGAHRSDMRLSDANGTPAEHASTGQQKAMLVGLVLAHAATVTESRGFPPLLLLDEPAVHLDPERRLALFDALLHLPAQTVVTGTDPDLFAPLAGAAEMLRAGSGLLTPESRFLSPEPSCSSVPGTL